MGQKAILAAKTPTATHTHTGQGCRTVAFTWLEGEKRKGMTTKHPNVGCLAQNWEPYFPSWLKLGMIGTPDWGDRVGLGLSRKKRK